MTAVGLLLLAAAALKIESPAEVLGAVAHTLRPLRSIGLAEAAAAAFCLIVVESFLGLALIVAPGRSARLASAALLTMFAIVLAARFSSAAAPPCGCLGRLLQSQGPAHVWLDAGRNLLLAAALVVMPLSPTAIDGSDRLRRLPLRPITARRAFTLVELLVVIAVLAVLLALVLPTLRWMRRAAEVTRSLSAQQQIVAAVHLYGQSSADFFPHFEALDGTTGPVRMRGYTIQTGYFRAHMGFWLAAVGPDDRALINLAIWPPAAQRGPLTDDELTRGLHYSVYFLTATIAADPAAFTDPIASGPLLDPALLRGVRWSEMTFPSRKGLFLDFALIEGESDDRYVAAFGDGSAAQLPGREPPEPIVPQPASGPQTIVISTRNGIRGVDR
ncbi:MAG: MauE/DoxX family redox-associated membrane protein [Phycisphaerales bacterium]